MKPDPLALLKVSLPRHPGFRSGTDGWMEVGQVFVRDSGTYRPQEPSQAARKNEHACRKRNPEPSPEQQQRKSAGNDTKYDAQSDNKAHDLHRSPPQPVGKWARISENHIRLDLRHSRTPGGIILTKTPARSRAFIYTGR